MTTLKLPVPQALHEGIGACNRGDWREGLTILTQIAQKVEGEKPLPGYFYSFLGVAMARVEGRKREGIELCRYGVSLSPKDPQNRLNLARVYMIDHKRASAIKQIEVGLQRQPNHRELRAFQKEIGQRRPPAIRFLSRDNPLNIWIGRITWRAQQAREEREAREREEAEFERLASSE